MEKLAAILVHAKKHTGHCEVKCKKECHVMDWCVGTGESLMCSQHTGKLL